MTLEDAMSERYIPLPVLTEALPITAIEDEVVIGGQAGVSLTPAAARETARLLIEAADVAERH